MRKILLVICLMLTAMCLAGCQHSHYIENQAYAVLMGIDREDGNWKITTRIPAIGSGGGQESGGGQGESEYLKFSAVGTSFPDALNVLGAGVPRDLELSALCVIVISEEIARSDAMTVLLDELAEERKIYGSTRIAVCEGAAWEFVEQQEPVIGSVLSEGLISRLENLEEVGYIPASQMDNVYFDMKSVYSDPLVMLCAIAEGDTDGTGDITAKGLAVEGEGKNRYMGAAVMKNGMMAGKLDGQQTLYVNLLRGNVDGFSYSTGKSSVQLAMPKKPKIKIDTRDGVPEIDIELKLLSLGMPEAPDMENVKDALERNIRDAISLLQSMGAEPFGFAAKAAGDFFTLGAWEEYDWQKAFSKAEIRITIDIKPIDPS